MTLGGPEIRDHAPGSRWWMIAVPAIAAPIILGFLQAGAGTVAASLPAAALAGWGARGVRKVVETDNPTVLARVWTRPNWLIYTVTGGVIFCGLAALALMIGNATSGYAPRGWSWLLSTIVWAPSVGAAGALAWKTYQGRQPQTVRNPMTPEQIIAARVTPWHFQKAQLTVKNPGHQADTFPAILDVQLDEMSNPYYIAQMVAGHQTIDDWKKKADRLAGAWEVSKVKITEEGINQVRVTVPLHQWTRTESVKWRPVYDPTPVDGKVMIPNVTEYMKALPMGEMSRSADPWIMPLVNKQGSVCTVVGGASGGGKGGFQRDLLAHLAMHPHIDIAGIDIAKRGAEFHDWIPRMSAVAKTREQAAQLIKFMVDEQEARFELFPEYETTNAWYPGKGGRAPMLGAEHHVKVLVIDEASELLEGGIGKDEEALIENIIRNMSSIIRLGRAAGFMLILLTQRPTANSIPSVLNKNMGRKIAFRMLDGYGAECTLSEVWSKAKLGDELDPVHILESEPGTAVTADGVGGYQRVQASWIEDDDVPKIVDRTKQWQQIWEWQTSTAGTRPSAKAEESWPTPKQEEAKQAEEVDAPDTEIEPEEDGRWEL